MFRSPVKTRSTKAPVRAPVDKSKPESPLSVNPDPAVDKPRTTMETAVESCVAKYLSSDKLIDSLAEKLAGRIERVVEDVVSRSLKTYIEQVNALKQQVSVLEERLRKAEVGKNKYDELEQYQRRNNIRVFGVPESSGEKTDDLLVQLFHEKMGVQVTLEQIDRSHRVGRRSEQQEGSTARNRPIIVKFTSYRDRQRVFTAKKKLKGSGIIVVEDLVPSRRELLLKATEKYGRGNTWTLDGRVMWVDGNGKRGIATRLEDITL